MTYGAGGRTRDHTIEITEQIASDTTLLPVAHLTAVEHSVAELRSIIGRLADAGVSNVMALRGDPPGDPMGEWVAHPEGLRVRGRAGRLLRAHGDFWVGVAAFPYKHPRSPNIESDTGYFVAKCRAARTSRSPRCSSTSTATCGCATGWRPPAARRPIMAGLMPVTNMGIIGRSEQFTGAPFPAELGARFAAIADDPKAVRAHGHRGASGLRRTVARRGRAGHPLLHAEPVQATREVWRNLALGARL